MSGKCISSSSPQLSYLPILLLLSSVHMVTPSDDMLQCYTHGSRQFSKEAPTDGLNDCNWLTSILDFGKWIEQRANRIRASGKCGNIGNLEGCVKEEIVERKRREVELAAADLNVKLIYTMQERDRIMAQLYHNSTLRPVYLRVLRQIHKQNRKMHRIRRNILTNVTIENIVTFRSSLSPYNISHPKVYINGTRVYMTLNDTHGVSLKWGLFNKIADAASSAVHVVEDTVDDAKEFVEEAVEKVAKVAVVIADTAVEVAKQVAKFADDPMAFFNLLCKVDGIKQVCDIVLGIGKALIDIFNKAKSLIKELKLLGLLLKNPMLLLTGRPTCMTEFDFYSGKEVRMCMPEAICVSYGAHANGRCAIYHGRKICCCSDVDGCNSYTYAEVLGDYNGCPRAK